MMRRGFAVVIFVPIALASVLYGCASISRQNVPSEARPSALLKQEASTGWSKYDVFPEVRQWSGEFPDKAYHAAYDAIEDAQPSVDLSSFSLTTQQADALIMAVFNRINFEFSYIHDITHSQDNKTLNFEYSHSPEECRAMVASFESRAQELTTTVLHPSYSEFRNVLSIYDWVLTHAQYSDTTSQGADMYNAYSAIVDETSICLGFTNALRYLLTRVGVECLSISSEDGSHMWNIVKIDGEYYHIDVTWGLGNDLQYFGINDDQRRAYNAFPDGWFVGNPNYWKIEAPMCDSDRFAPLWQASNYSLAEDGLHYYRPENDTPMVWGWNSTEPKQKGT